MRLIDADALKEKIDNIWNGRPLSFLGARILAMIDFAPTIDAVSVVRCKECRWFDKGENDACSWSQCTRHFCQYFGVSENDFCSYGEREGE